MNKSSATTAQKMSVPDNTGNASFDWWLFTLAMLIMAIGLVMVLSASGIVAEQSNGDKYYFFKYFLELKAVF